MTIIICLEKPKEIEVAEQACAVPVADSPLVNYAGNIKINKKQKARLWILTMQFLYNSHNSSCSNYSILRAQ